jgi:hypothetical protein
MVSSLTQIEERRCKCDLTPHHYARLRRNALAALVMLSAVALGAVAFIALLEVFD